MNRSAGNEPAIDTGAIKPDVAWDQVQGRRSSQQDCAICVPLEQSRYLLVLADGMGGEVGGDIASSLAVRSFCAGFEAHDSSQDPIARLLDALKSANLALYDRVKAEPYLAGMGTTLIGAILDCRELRWVSVGDSSMWLFRDGELRRLNANHSVGGQLAELVAAGEITAEEAANEPGQSQLLEAVMGEDIRLVDMPVDPLRLLSGDVLILASDGIDTCLPNEIAGILLKGGDCSSAELVDRILRAVEAHERPFQDNATLIVVRIPSNNTHA